MAPRKKRILIVCPYPEKLVPSQRLKYEQYFSHFREAGYELTVSPFMDAEAYRIIYKKGHLARKVAAVLRGYLKRLGEAFTLGGYDGIYVSLAVAPFGTFMERLFRRFAKKVIYDIDDLVFLGHTADANRMIARLKGPAKYHYMMKCSDHVITCTPYLDEYVRRYNAQTTDISSTIDTDKYVPKAGHSNAGPVVLGWSGSITTAPYLKLLAKVLCELQPRFGFKVLVIGDASFSVPGLEVEAIAWKEATEVEDLRRIDIGLYPLPDEQWVLGKSGLKALQYMALCIPPVATAVGANFRVIEDGVSGFLVKNEAEWKDRLVRLLEDPELRTRLGAQARLRVEKMYSIRSTAPTYLEVFYSVYGRP